MNFRSTHDDAPEINLIPFIDVLLVVIIFLMLSTTYARFTELQVNLPEASASPSQERPAQIVVAVSAEGRYAVDGQSIDGRSIELLTARLLASAKQSPSPTVIVSADAAAAHQSVINVLDAARRAGLLKITFAAQTPGQGSLTAR